MYYLDKIVGLYFNAVNIRAILEGKVKYSEFSYDEFVKLVKPHFIQNSDTENRQLYSYMLDSISEEGHPFAGMSGRSALNVFAALEELSEQLLTTEANETVCVYKYMLRCRDVTRNIEEDLLVCAYLAMRYKRFRQISNDFTWDVAIRHNNSQLSAIMKRKISENHFHLYGSAPSFHLIWIELMNNLDSNGMIDELDREFREKQREIRQHYSNEYLEEQFKIRILKSALIRIYLFKYCSDINNDINASEMQCLLEDRDSIISYQDVIRKEIESIKNTIVINRGVVPIDYALYNVKNVSSTKIEQFYNAGERWLIYQMLKMELSGELANPDLAQWFYAYLVMKQSIRSELVQINSTIGFENFSIYSKNKGIYKNYRNMIECAVYGSMRSNNIKSLEIRISPEKTAEENAETLKFIDDTIQARGEDALPGNCYYFVYHFTKCSDILPQRNCFTNECHRHYIKRKELSAQAKEIIKFRNLYPDFACLLKGIDACSQEIGCRPEVFAPVYRMLSQHIVVNQYSGGYYKSVGQLRKTYHVGEDFLDIVDGLRAIDEAVRFLNLECGDRLGHGTVLGIDVYKWYRFKQNTILINKQDYLDNIVWLYHKISKIDLKNNENLRIWLLEQFDYYYHDIYDSCNENDPESNIFSYYEAWKLRGDDPELYKTGTFKEDATYTFEWMVNRKYPEHFEHRERKDICQLYYKYHFDYDVRDKGSHSIQVLLPQMYIEAVSLAQKVLQKEFSSLGIGIETNPSSNLAISTLQDYGEHPIINLYNIGLTANPDELSECPQINVSINTDDKGIFHTSLENEYGFLACAVEKMTDSTGAHKYSRQMVYEWIDNIREMGNMQSFS